MSGMNKRILLKSRPVGEPTAENFELVETPVPTPGQGQFRVKVIYMSLDPYMRGRMGAEKTYAANAEVGETMVGGGVGVVEESNNDQFKPGDYVMCATGWQSYCLSDGTAASGAVGGVVGQIAKIKGCRAIGIAGSADKCAFVVDELGFDACLNYKSAEFPEELARACPDGVDVYFENVGGKVFEAVLPLLNDDSRMPVCGLISQYNMTELPEGTNMLPALMRSVLTHRILIQGFIISYHFHHLPAFLKDVSGWIKEGKLKYREDIVKGIENAPEAFMGLLKGKNFGKLLVQVADDPTR